MAAPTAMRPDSMAQPPAFADTISNFTVEEMLRLLPPSVQGAGGSMMNIRMTLRAMQINDKPDEVREYLNTEVMPALDGRVVAPPAIIHHQAVRGASTIVVQPSQQLL